MSLYRRTFLIIITIMLSLIVMLTVVARLIILERFRQLEEADTRRQVERALSAMSGEIAELNKLVGDWSPWDETYTFVEDGNAAFIQSNVVDQVFTMLHINAMLFINLEGQLVFSQGFDRQQQHMAPLSADLKTAVI